MVSFQMHRQVASLSSFVRTLGTLKRWWLVTALKVLVSSHRTLPSVSLSAESAEKFQLLLLLLLRFGSDGYLGVLLLMTRHETKRRGKFKGVRGIIHCSDWTFRLHWSLLRLLYLFTIGIDTVSRRFLRRFVLVQLLDVPAQESDQTQSIGFACNKRSWIALTFGKIYYAASEF